MSYVYYYIFILDVSLNGPEAIISNSRFGIDQIINMLCGFWGIINYRMARPIMTRS